MNLTRRQISLLVSSIVALQDQLLVSGGEINEELEELIELLDQEHQKIMETSK